MKRLYAALATGAFLIYSAVALASPATIAWDNERDAFDTGVGASAYSWSGLPYFTSVRDFRPYFRTHAQNCIDQTTLDAMRACVVQFQADLARPGPAHSVAKDLHTATRRFGDDALHLIP